MTKAAPTAWECEVCGYVFDENQEGKRWEDLPDDWECPICGASKGQFAPVGEVLAETTPAATPGDTATGVYLKEWARSGDDVETRMADIPLGNALIEDVLIFVLQHLRAGPRALDDKPGTAEVLAFLLALYRLEVPENGGLRGCYSQARGALGTLAKNDKDLKKLERQLESYCKN